MGCMPSPESPKLGRPSLREDQLAKVLGSLLLLKKGTPEYRRKRRELATETDRTERAIDTVFEQLKARHLDAGSGPQPT